MTPRELLDCTDIAEVWAGLGGPPLRNNRGSAWWRGSESRSVSVSPGKNCWHDFKAGEGGGGVLALVQRVLGCDKRTASQWLASFYNVSLDNRPLSLAQRREWRERRTQAEARAAELTGWREGTLKAIRECRNCVISDDLTICWWARHALAHGALEDDWEFAWGVIAGTLDIDRLNRWVCRLEAMAPAEVISLQQRMEARAA